MYDIAAAINAEINASCTADPNQCGCRGTGWFLSDYDSWHACPCHPHRAHPETVGECGGRYPELQMVNRRGEPVTVRGDISHALYDYTPKGVEQARRDARRLTDRLARYGWRAQLRWTTIAAPEMTAATVEVPKVDECEGEYDDEGFNPFEDAESRALMGLDC